MKELLIDMVSGLPPEVAVFLLAMTPIIEVRGSIPLAIGFYNMSPLAAIVWSFLGNITAGFLVIVTAMPIVHWVIARYAPVRHVWEKYIHRIETRNRAAFEKWGAIALVLFVAIPLPMTGVFAGAVASTIFQVPLRRSLPLLLIGSIIASLLVATVTVGFRALAQGFY